LAVGLAGAGLAATTILSLIGYGNLTTWTGLGIPGPYYDPTLILPPLVETLSNIAAGWAFGIAGLIAMDRRPGNLVGTLMVLIGASFLTRFWVYLPAPLLVSFGLWAGEGEAPLVLLGILLLSYPSGRIPSWSARAWVAFAFVYLLGIQLALTLFEPFGIWVCPDCRPLITLSYDERISTTIYWVGTYTLLLLAAGLITLLIRRWTAASRPARRQLTPVWLAGLVFTGVALTIAFISNTAAGTPGGRARGATWIAGEDLSYVPPPTNFLLIQVPSLVWDVLTWVWAASLFVVPIALVVVLVRSHLGQAAVSALALELRRTGERPPLVESLRRALADRSLELGLWSRPASEYVTPEGLPLHVPERGASRGVTRLDGDDGPLAVMIHDPALAEQQTLVDGVGAVAHLALENERLHAEVKAQLEEVRASRERIASAADAERRKVERDLHDGAQQRLVSLSLALGMARREAADAAPEVAATLERAEAELKQAIAELRELARGIHPAVLTEAGLAAAVESLADHSPMAVTVESDLNGRRLPPLVEATGYFVVAEALTNAAKHASASHVAVSVTANDGWLRLVVTDDGIGGADPGRGSGLRGLLDRVAVLGGRLRVEDGAPAGTRLEAEIPCA
jgi:signal transduction histidine kinase